MKIVVLDGYTLNPGDLDWHELKSLGDCEIHDRTPPPEVLVRAAKTEIVLTNKTVLTREQIQSLPQLKYIGVLATGTNIVDVLAARERNIPVTNVPSYGTRSVAQMTLALLLTPALRYGPSRPNCMPSTPVRSQVNLPAPKPLAMSPVGKPPVAVT